MDHLSPSPYFGARVAVDIGARDSCRTWVLAHRPVSCSPYRAVIARLMRRNLSRIPTRPRPTTAARRTAAESDAAAPGQDSSPRIMQPPGASGHPRSDRHARLSLHASMHPCLLEPQIPTLLPRPLLPASTIRMLQVCNFWGRGGPKMPAVRRPKSSSPSGFKIIFGPAIFFHCARSSGVVASLARPGGPSHSGRLSRPSSGGWGAARRGWAAVAPRPPPTPGDLCDGI